MRTYISILILVLTLSSCNDSKRKLEESNNEINALRTELDSLKTVIDQSSNASGEQIATFLTFQENNAEEAMNFYISIFDNSKITSINRYGKDGPAKEGTIMMATFELNGSKFVCSDSFVKHEWDFTPGVSNYIECKSEAEIESLFNKLSENGTALMPLGNYGWSSKFAFIQDQFGVSWQLNLP